MSAADKTRRVTNWVEGFCDYCDVLQSPRLFCRWAAISLLSSVIERKLWVYTKGSNLYPNLYIILVGPPGQGKTAVLSQSRRFLQKLIPPSGSNQGPHIAPSYVSSASLIDAVADAKVKVIRINEVPNYVEYNYLTVIATEMQVFLPEYDPKFMGALTDIYDGESHESRLRTNKLHIKIEHPQINLIGGTTPSYLNSFLPEGAWDQGFTSRTVIVFSGEEKYTPIFGGKENHDRLGSLYVSLLDDLRDIQHLFGKLSWTVDAAGAITEWDKRGRKPVPEHGKLLHYNSRRLAHLIKLCIVASISQSNSLSIEVGDYQLALDWLLEAEAVMPDIFTSMGGISGDGKAMEDVWFMVYKLWSKNQRPVPEHVVVTMLKQRVPAYSIMNIIAVMLRSNMLKQEIVGSTVCYVPQAKV